MKECTKTNYPISKLFFAIYLPWWLGKSVLIRMMNTTLLLKFLFLPLRPTRALRRERGTLRPTSSSRATQCSSSNQRELYAHLHKFSPRWRYISRVLYIACFMHFPLFCVDYFGNIGLNLDAKALFLQEIKYGSSSCGCTLFRPLKFLKGLKN